jgi:hypothetical protein
MSVTAVSGIYSLGQGQSDQQGGTPQTMNALRNALSSGNLAAAQNAMTQLQAQQHQLPTSGIRAAASDDPQSTLRADMLALQNSLDSGDITAAQQSLVKLIQDNQQIASAQQALQAQPGHQPVTALPSPSEEPNSDDGSAGGATTKETGNLIDVMA